MSEFETLKKFVAAAMTDDQDELSRLILENDISQQKSAQHAAINAFLLTKANISKNIMAANKLAGLEESESWDLRTSLRFEVLKETLLELSPN